MPGVVHLGAEDRHSVRIEAKKLRYGAEFFGPLFRGDKAVKRHKTFVGALAVTLLDADADSGNERAILEPGVGETPLWQALIETTFGWPGRTSVPQPQ